jgi:superfamily I DNA/RNA helicase
VLPALLQRLDLAPRSEIGIVDRAVQALDLPYVVRSVRSWLDTQRRVLGRQEVGREEVQAEVGRALSLRRRIGHAEGSPVTATTAHGAKNREFDGVIVLWPYAVKGSDDQKRRLLYNAVTRAKSWCQVLVQSADLTARPPFA